MGSKNAVILGALLVACGGRVGGEPSDHTFGELLCHGIHECPGYELTPDFDRGPRETCAERVDAIVAGADPACVDAAAAALEAAGCGAIEWPGCDIWVR